MTGNAVGMIAGNTLVVNPIERTPRRRRGIAANEAICRDLGRTT